MPGGLVPAENHHQVALVNQLFSNLIKLHFTVVTGSR
jgi:hypothetical protein